MRVIFLPTILCASSCTEQNFDEDNPSTPTETYQNITLDTALTISQTRRVMEQKGSCLIAVKGYIVGCINGTSLSQFQNTGPFLKESNIVIADSPIVKDISQLTPIKLVNQSSSRKELNLVDHPGHQYRMLYVYGKMETYFKTTGITNIKTHKLGFKEMNEYIFDF